jgi:hypothetical protein
MTPKEILKLPYIQFVIGMLDAPGVDYDSKKKEDDIHRPKGQKAEIAALTGFLG